MENIRFIDNISKWGAKNIEHLSFLLQKYIFQKQ